MNSNNILGVDIGSIAISIAEVDQNRNIKKSSYSFHKGEIRSTLEKMLDEYQLDKISHIATTSSTPSIFSHYEKFDSRICTISTATKLHQKIGSILEIGGEKFSFISFKENGDYDSFRANTSCAAGTGGFLDQQATRLNLKDIQTFCKKCESNKGDIPKIASRCAVFAKTDLIHAQQEGYSLEEICDGLAQGVAKNVVDTLFTNSKPNLPLLLIGGVSKNGAVVKHLTNLIESEITVDTQSNLYGAIGAALTLLNEETKTPPQKFSKDNILKPLEHSEKSYHYQPLELKKSIYPEFDSEKRYLFKSKVYEKAPQVEVDIYKKVSSEEKLEIYLGIDIGSTSTKATIINDTKEVILGLYTRTSGKPVEACQIIFEAIEEFKESNKLNLVFKGVGTTGSGRKFIGKIIDADIALDEITAHARAAFEIDKEVDTIIEIGGQDAKFTTLKEGVVTASIMNNVCAAGTGSFIEEQAKKLNCPLTEYPKRTEKKKAPLANDRCTVFMERDINYYLSEGYSTDEVLAAVLHSICENYLTKVAVEKNIGNKILFQGATAKNKALIAAFEQRLGKSIIVSKYCHLTGALGVALDLHSQKLTESKFRGIDLYKNPISLKNEICDQCNNHCKIKLANISGETVAFGFLCGKEYEDKGRTKENKAQYDLLREYKKAFHYEKPKKHRYDFTIGIPAALHVFEDIPFWERFFDYLSIKTVSSKNYKHGLKDGKRIAGAEFCAPMMALHGHVKYLMDKADYVFLPNYLELKNKDKNIKRNYCYFTQYASAITLSTPDLQNAKILNPLIKSTQSIFATKLQLFKMLKQIARKNINLMEVSLAYDNAKEHTKTALEKLKNSFNRESQQTKDVQVVLVGRPYTILSPHMNNGILQILSKHNVKSYYQDMLRHDKEKNKVTEEILKALHWNYAASILSATETIANMDGIYPILVTSFKCTPDSFIMEYFKGLLDKYKKPYLILQLDEHGSNVGYETRIEASIRTFRNHYLKAEKLPIENNITLNPAVTENKEILSGKTLLLPNWDPETGLLMQAVLRREGVDARLLEVTTGSIQRSLKSNTGQCLPLTSIAQDTVEYVKKHNLDPNKVVLWSINSKISCGLGMFPHYIKKILTSYEDDMSNIAVYLGDITFLDFSFKASASMYFAYMFSGLLKRVGCKIRPYEVNKGETDRAIEKSVSIIYEMLSSNFLPKEEKLQEVIQLFKEIEHVNTNKPKVAIFGDLYARDNCVLNQDLIKTIEDNGGEAIVTSYHDFMKIVGEPYIKKWLRQGYYKDAAMGQLMYMLLPKLERKYVKIFNEVLKEPEHDFSLPYEEILANFNITVEHVGESMENTLKLYTLKEHNPDISLFVQTSPAYCCPSMVTEAMTKKLEDLLEVPIVTIEYDGIGGFKNDKIIPYLKFAKKPAKITTYANSAYN